MSETVAKLAARKGRVPALVVALVVLGWLVFNELLQLIINSGWKSSAEASGNLYDVGYGDFWIGFGQQFLTQMLPFSLGVFICLWAIAPISHELGVRFVLTRAGLASLAGAILASLFSIVVALFSAIRAPEYWFSNSFTPGGFEGGMFLSSLIGSLIGIITTSIGLFPLVALTVVLLWLWLREHPREYEISGLIDEL
jgi:hypothetical protein